MSILQFPPNAVQVPGTQYRYNGTPSTAQVLVHGCPTFIICGSQFILFCWLEKTDDGGCDDLSRWRRNNPLNASPYFTTIESKLSSRHEILRYYLSSLVRYCRGFLFVVSSFKRLSMRDAPTVGSVRVRRRITCWSGEPASPCTRPACYVASGGGSEHQERILIRTYSTRFKMACPG